MIAKTLYFGSAYQLTTQHQQLVCTDKNTGECRTIPIEDIAFVLIDHPEIYLSMPTIQALTLANVALIFCDSKHHPLGLVLPLEAHTLQSERFKVQIQAKKPLLKQLWQQTIETKILNQARLLMKLGKEAQPLLHLSKQVKSGDTTNTEGQASRIYWKNLLGHLQFKRDRFGLPPNHLLNFGYAILRAAVARALVGSGLLPTLGIHHQNRYNAFCLADDIMEPYRPWIDEAVYHITETQTDYTTLDKTTKATLLRLLTADTKMGKEKSPLMIALSMTSASLVRCFQGEATQISYPHFI